MFWWSISWFQSFKMIQFTKSLTNKNEVRFWPQNLAVFYWKPTHVFCIKKWKCSKWIIKYCVCALHIGQDQQVAIKIFIIFYLFMYVWLHQKFGIQFEYNAPMRFLFYRSSFILYCNTCRIHLKNTIYNGLF